MEQARDITDISEYRIKRRRAGSARWILVLIFLVACLFAGYFFARSGFFTISQAEISGNSVVSDERLLQLSGFEIGGNLFSVTVSDAEQWLCIEPRVKSAEVRRKWPHTVVIRVVERQPAALIAVDWAMIEIDDTGRVLSRYQLVSQVGLPLISGLDMSDQGVVPGGVIDAAGVAQALEVLRALPANAEDVGEINVANTQDIRLYTVGGVQIKLGDSSDFAEKYNVYSNILADHQSHGTRLIDYIDVSIFTDPAIKYR